MWTDMVVLKKFSDDDSHANQGFKVTTDLIWRFLFERMKKRKKM